MDPIILVATDFSPRSDRALRRAAMLAKQFGMALSLVHVVDDDQPQYLIDAQAAASSSMLQESARTLRQIDRIDARAHLVAGDVPSGILQAAEKVAPALIVMGPHRRQLRDAFIGTTAQRTIAHTSHPVLMTGGVPSSPYSKALIALDLDEASKTVADCVRRLPILRGTRMVAMHAFDAPAQGMMKRGMSDAEAVRHYVASEERRAEAEFQDMLSALGIGSVRRALVPINGTPARTILEAARDEEAALVIVGTSQSRGLKRFLLGSAAQDVLADTDRDVLVIPHGHAGLKDESPPLIERADLGAHRPAVGGTTRVERGVDSIMSTP
jgi:nucleotide-binding universal stress UspA family protein